MTVDWCRQRDSERRENVVVASAPGKVILFGEHAVVYDKLGIAASIDTRCFVRISGLPTTPYPRDCHNRGNIVIHSKNFGIERRTSVEEINEILSRYEELRRNNDLDGIKEMSKDVLAPLLVVMGFVMRSAGTPAENFKIEINSHVPKNLGSSSSLFAAACLGLSAFLGKKMSRDEVSKIAYEGDVVAHGGTPSGIDNTIVTHGGYLTYRKSRGFDLLSVNFEIPLLLVDSGEPARTSETVPFVRKLFEEKREFTESILCKLDRISISGLEAIKQRDLTTVGKLMTEYYRTLRQLEISTEKLDEIIRIALSNDALGAKPTGGWGGGCCLVVAKNSDELIKLKRIYEEFSFRASIAKLGAEGVRLEGVEENESSRHGFGTG